jgi:hypothetical protein
MMWRLQSETGSFAGSGLKGQARYLDLDFAIETIFIDGLTSGLR